MISTIYQELFTTADGIPTGESLPRGFKSRVGAQLDEIAVFALVAVAVLYVAAASLWFVF
jgi:hypothetical protein